jgi:4-amino-4-deoxy-L-arabinose transferase-like glycosyltransferase
VRKIKPAGMYWFMMSGVALFGPTELAFRFWSAVAGLVTVLATYHIGRRLFHPEVGFWGAIVLATSLMFAVLARAAKVDSLLIMFDTLALLVFVCAVFRRRAKTADVPVPPRLRWSGHFYPQSTWAVIGMYALMGAAILGKGPIGLILPTAVIGMFLLIMRLPAANDSRYASWLEPGLERRFAPIALTAGWLTLSLLIMKMSVELGLLAVTLLAMHVGFRRLPIYRPFAPRHFLGTCWYMRPITAVLAAGAVALPWHFWVGARDFSWIEGFYVQHNLGRAASAMEGHGGPALLYYPLTILIGLLPWSMFIVPMAIGMIRRMRRGDPWRSGYVLMACWIGVYVGLFSLARTKLPNYVVPAYPALALATACYIYHLRRATTAAADWWPKVAMGAFALVGVAVAVGLPVAAHALLPGEEWLGLIGLVPIVGAGVCFLLFQLGKRRTATVSFAASAVLLAVTLLAGVAQRVDRHQRLHVLLKEVAQRSDDPQLAAVICLEPSWVFYHNHNIPVLPQQDGEEVHRFFNADGDRFLIVVEPYLEQLEDDLPPGVEELARAPYFLQGMDLVLLGTADGHERIANSRLPRH